MGSPWIALEVATTTVFRVSCLAAVLVPLIWLVSTGVGRRIPAAWHSYLWLIVAVRLVLPVVPEAPTSIANLLPGAVPVHFPIGLDEPRAAAPVSPVTNSADPSARAGHEVVTHPALADGSTNVPTRIDSPFANRISAAVLALSAMWVIGMLVLTLRWMLDLIRLRRLIRSCQPILDARWLRIAEECRREVGLHRLPKMIQAPDGISPAIAGVWQPTLLIPLDAASHLDDESLRQILLHELRHIWVADCILSSVWRGLCIVHWFNPGVWIARRLWSAEREMACDAWVLRNADSMATRRYGKMLLTIAEGTRLAETLRWAPGMISRSGSIEKRVRHMKTIQQRSRQRPVLAMLLLVILIAVGLTDRSASSTTTTGDRASGAVDNNSQQGEAQTSQKATKDSAAPNTARQEQPQDSATIIVAKHVVLLDGEVVTWEQLADSLRKRSAAAPMRVGFHYSIGVFEDFKMWQERADELNKELKFRSFFLSFLSPPASQRYDAVRSAADLKQDPARKRSGVVQREDGSPVAEATVVLRQVGEPECTIYLNDGRVRDQVDELWTTTDAQGRFAVYPAKDEFILAVLHPDGFLAVTPKQLQDNKPIRLEPWGMVRLTLQHDAKQPQSAGLSITVRPEGASLPLHFQIFTAETKDGPLTQRFLVPPGNVWVQRIVSHSGLAAGSLPVEAGEVRNYALTPPTNADVESAREIQKKLEPK